MRKSAGCSISVTPADANPLDGTGVADLTAVCDYLEKHESPAFAQRVAKTIYGAAQSLSSFPKKGRPGREPETRELVIQRYPYIVVYELRADAVEILSVVHTSQQWP